MARAATSSAAPLRGRVVIIDDVITAGTAIRESIELIRSAGAQPVAVALALDRQERGQGDAFGRAGAGRASSASTCVSIITLADLIEALSSASDGRLRISAEQLTSLRAYRERYGVK